MSIGKPGDGGCRLFVTDLDGDGNRDLILLNANGGSGPNGVTMTIVAFDSVGRPVPWQATGPFELEDDRLTSLVDLDGDKRAELLFQYVEGTSQEMSIHTALYKIVSGYFKRVDGMFAGKKFPLEQVRGETGIDIPDLSN